MNLDVEDLVSGSTYVPIDAAMRYIKNQSSFTPLLDVKNIGDDDVTQTHTKQFRPIWPIYLYPCQNMNSYGARFPVIATLKIHNIAEENQTNFDTTQTLWITMALLTRIQFVWDSISKVTLCSSQWEGWFLNLLSRSCFNNLSSIMNKTDPFKPSLF